MNDSHHLNAFFMKRRKPDERLALAGITRDDIVELLASLDANQRLMLWNEAATYRQTHDPLKVGDIVMLDTKAAEDYEHARYGGRRPIMTGMINNRYMVKEIHEGDLYAIDQIPDTHSTGGHWWGRAPRHVLKKVSP